MIACVLPLSLKYRFYPGKCNDGGPLVVVDQLSVASTLIRNFWSRVLPLAFLQKLCHTKFCFASRTYQTKRSRGVLPIDLLFVELKNGKFQIKFPLIRQKVEWTTRRKASSKQIRNCHYRVSMHAFLKSSFWYLLELLYWIRIFLSYFPCPLFIPEQI